VVNTKVVVLISLRNQIHHIQNLQSLGNQFRIRREENLKTILNQIENKNNKAYIELSCL